MKKIILYFLLTIFAVASLKLDIDKLIEEGKKGNKEALYQLGFMYENGNGVEKDLKKAYRYYSQAVELGSEDAKLSLAVLNLSKHINEKSVSLSNSVEVKGSTKLNYQLSVSDLKDVVQKAKKGDSDAIFTLATIYDNGYGDIKANKSMALALYKKAAKLGNAKAAEVLSIMKK